MDNRNLKNFGVQVRQIAKYAVLLPFIVWLAFSAWIASGNAFPFSVSDGISFGDLLGAAGIIMIALLVLGDIVYRVIHNISIPVGVMSSLLFYVGILLLAFGQYLPYNKIIFYMSLILTDLLLILAVFALLKGESFTAYALCCGEVRIEK